ncbi:hypothetical protein BOTBODRAFT_180786 [Botryobasidium botryosum FD-172 SS1]|uniref:Cytochrome P450 n=1 Tax=Botryobasidium botryosum (strain FD-172 SS1) TaxID=930990 RepID=A0A067LVL2_BOTB1|nr:hypothetical protein BOTBODRAFT_180786 [Botryobasidium botryosum FD-172 SS1]
MLKIALAFLATLVASRIYKFWSGLKAVSFVPGPRCALSPRSKLGLYFPTKLNRFFFNAGVNFLWEAKRAGGFARDHDVLSVVPWLYGPPILYVSSIEMMRQVLGYSDDFDKVTNSPASELFGENVAVVQKERWKKHRRVLNPAFSPKLYTLVWKESIRTFRDMISTEGWVEKGSVAIPAIIGITSKARPSYCSIFFTFNIISSCAFDFRFPWAKSTTSSGAEMSIPECFKVVITYIPIRLLAPTWAYYLPSKVLKRVDAAYDTIFSFMRSRIATRREKLVHEELNEDNGLGANTIFNNIIRANLDGGKFAFDENEVIGNTFAMLFVGHETTSRTLAAVLALLGVYQDEQEKVYQEIERVLSDGREPAFEDFESFPAIRNCIHESMRLYPPATVVIREAMKDVRLDVTDKLTGEKSHEIVVKKGALVLANILEIQYNPRHFPDPEAFKPSRWTDSTVDSDTFVGFGLGPRGCIGRKFSLVEATCFLVMLLRDWKVDIDLLGGESPVQWRQRVMTEKAHATLGLGPIPLRFSRRNSK